MEYPKSASFPKWENYDLERLVNILSFTKGEEWLNWDFPQNIPDWCNTLSHGDDPKVIK